MGARGAARAARAIRVGVQPAQGEHERHGEVARSQHMARTKVFSYRVTGWGAFPIDMLRYDAAWPARQEDVSRVMLARMDDDYRDIRSVDITSHSAPTEARWASFGWRVSGITWRYA